MATNLDNAILFGKESVYGTAVAFARAFEGKSDGWKRKQEFLESKGMRGGAHTIRTGRSRPVNMGGEGKLDIDILSSGFGMLGQAMLGTVAGPTLVSGTAFKSTFVTDPTDPDDSWTVQFLRADASGVLRPYTHKGSVITSWELKHDVGSLLNVGFMFDCQDVDTAIAAGTPVYPASGGPFDWTQCAATWNGSPIDLKNFSLKGDLGYDTERRFLRGSALKKKPIRKDVPMFNGDMEVEFDGLTQYNAFVAGTEAPLVLTWTGSPIGANFEIFKVTVPLIQFQGGSPDASLAAVTKQMLPFRVLHGASAAMTIEYTSTDTVL